MTTGEPAGGQDRKILSLTGVRFIFALMIVIYHARPLIAESWIGGYPFLMNLAETGYVGVSFFYVLSGFILTLVYSGHINSLHELKNFWVARFARVYPSYFIAFLLSLPLAFMGVLNWGPGIADKVIAVSSNLFLLQAWLPRYVQHLNAAAWSLSVEAFFYLLFPAILMVMGRNFRTVGVVTSMVIYYLLSQIIPAMVAAKGVHGVGDVVANGTDQIIFNDTASFLSFFPVLRLPEFLFGIVLAQLYQLHRQSLEKYGYIFSLAGMAGLIVLLAGFSDKIPYLMLNNGFLIPFIAMLIIGLALRESRLLSSLFFVVLGESSYALYILHIPVGKWLGWTGLYDNYMSHMPLLYCMVLITVTVSASVLVWRFYETKLRYRIRSWSGM